MHLNRQGAGRSPAEEDRHRAAGLIESTDMARLLLGNSLRGAARRLPLLQHVLWAVEGSVFGLFMTISRGQSPERASALGRRLLRAIGPHLDKTRIIRRNLTLAFPEKTAGEIEALTREVWGNLGAVLAEYPHLQTIAAVGGPERLEIVNNSDSPVFQDTGTPGVFVSAHLANWEISIAAAKRLGIPTSVLYTPLQNPRLDRMLYEARAQTGANLLPREGGIKTLLRELGSGRSIGLLVDQRVDSGMPVPFFGIDMNTSTTPARLALRYHCDLIPVRVQRLGNARFRITFEKPIRPPETVTDERERILDMTRQLNGLFETWIREQPQDWLCTKRRWGKDAERP
jgi:KDO2-lipid IV(A) lauroyltransferase